MKFKTKLGLGVGGLAVLLGGTVLASAFMDAGWMRTRLVEAVEHQTGRTLRIDSLHVWLLPYPWISAQGVGLSNIPGSPNHEMFTANEVRARLAISPLFHHRVVLDDVSLSDPHLTLERTSDGAANWILTPLPSSGGVGDNAASGSRQHWNLAVASLHLRDGAASWSDERNHITGTADLDRADLTGLDGTMAKIDVRGHHGSGHFTVSGTTGPLPPTDGQPWPLNLTATLSVDKRKAGQIQIGGVVADPLHDAGYDIQINGAIDQLRDLETIFPNAGLPDATAVSLQAGVTGSGRTPSLRMLHLRAGPTSLEQLMLGLRASSIALDADDNDQRVAISLNGQLDAQPVTVHGTLGTLTQTTQALRTPDKVPMPVTLSLGQGEASITVDGALGGRLTSLDVHGALPALTFGAGKPGFQGLRVSGGIVSSAPLSVLEKADPTSLLKTSAGSLDVSAQRMSWQSVAWEAVSAHVTVGGARLTVDPLFGTGTGNTSGIAQSGRIVYDASGAAPHLTITAAPFVLPTQMMQTSTGMPPLVNGSMQVVGTVTADGSGLDEWEQTATGHVGLSMVGGRVDGKALEAILGRNIPIRGTLALRCFGAHMQLTDGLATINRLGLESDLLSLTGHGTVKLTNGALDLHLSPRIGVGGAAASSPVAVTGTVDTPQPRLEPGADGRFAISIGGSSDTGDQCPDLLATAREGVAGPAAAPPPANKAGGIMNMLKGLLR
ncbi:AsmA family protein [Acetobacter sp.]|jgi:AsmA protein|uniref:AsmA family protein n=1 Tax=Acetobacter sp. TaxID=440 RepID=UPI0025BE6F70|nr:AsmA family protein [Acetobacter sp.]MCH4090788.1 AsmA family protein [Acetobacter sp.]MCI1300496.1 AsmA family protein [Acetobacter sp.]MCI1316302.1 AsmA family protein [Acetobacter sp.]